MRSYNDFRHWCLAMVVLLVLGGLTTGSATVFAQSGTATSEAVPDNATPDIGNQVVVTINIDVTDVDSPDQNLGSYSGSLDWNPAVLEYNTNSGPPAGFTGVVNPTSGHIAFNGANASGATGNITVLEITFDVVGGGTSPLDLEYSAMAAATTFENLLPLLTVTDGQVDVSGPPAAEDLVYMPVTPCRIVDTRKTSAGMIGASTQRDFDVFGLDGTISAQGGNPAGCPSPLGEPLAVHINMVAVNPTGKGNLQAFPVGAGTGTGLSVNYNKIGTNLANTGTVATVTGAGPDITVASNFSSAHTVIDVLGYYYSDEGLLYTPVDPCRIVDTRKTPAGIINANTERTFNVYGSTVDDQGGEPAGCSLPPGLDEPYAAHINMVAVNPTGKGNLQAFPVGAGTGTGLSVNYNTIGTNLANAGTVKTNPDITVASNFSSAHAVIDVLGYYHPLGDLLYTAVKPCRIVDTRKTSAGVIGASTQRGFDVFGSDVTISAQGGNPAGCPSPLGEPLAVHINMVAVNPTGKGNLQAFPVGAGTGTGLSVNYNKIGTNLANAGTVATVTGAGPDIEVASNFSSAHTVIDVLGYYYSAP